MEAHKSAMETKADLPWLALLLVGFLALGTFLALYMLSWDAEWGFLYFGYLSLTGEVRLFQDEIVPRRLPLPFHVIGISQLLAGPSLLAARLWSLLLGALTVALTFVFGRSLGGRACGFLSALFLVTHALVVGYFAAASYYAMSSLLIVAGLLAISRGRSLLGMMCFSLMSLNRAHLVVMVPVVLIYLLLRARDKRERIALLALTVLPPVAFLASSPDHIRILAYVPFLDRLVEPLGYRSLLVLGAEDLIPTWSLAKSIVWFGKRHVFWVLATAALAGGWGMSWVLRRGIREVSPPSLIVLSSGLAICTMVWQVFLVHPYLKPVAAWTAAFAPLWAVVLGYGASALLEPQRAHPVVRGALVALLLFVFALSPTFSRHAAMPLDLPPRGTTVGLLEEDAARIRSIVQPGQRVFLLGSPIPAYLAGVSPYPQQITSMWTLVPSEDDYAVTRSGLWGRRQVDEWLSRDAPFALVQPAILKGLGTIESYRGLVTQIESLLERHFTLVATVGQPPWTPSFGIYARKTQADHGAMRGVP
jgi:hypothetical protein